MLIHNHGQPGASSRPPEIATASSHTDTMGSTNRRAAARAAASIAHSASAHELAAGSGITGSGSNARNHTVNTPRTGSARPANRRIQPRTVSTGLLNAAAIDRYPPPAAFAANADPITTAASARRTSSTTGNNTCVTPQPAHRDRRGRTRTGPCGPRTVRSRP